MINRLAGFVAALCIVIFGALAPSHAIADVSGLPSVTYDYRAPIYDNPNSYTAPERGPPAMFDHAYARNADVRWSHGQSARPGLALWVTTYTYDHTAPLVQVPSVAHTTHRPTGGTEGDAAASDRSGVAANAGTRSIDDLLRPGGLTIGKAGTDDSIREITGGLPEAQAMFQQLSHGGTVVAQTPKLTRVELPNGGGVVQLRTVMSRSPNTTATIDVNIPGLDITKLKYNP